MDELSASPPSPFETPKVIDEAPKPLKPVWVSALGIVMCVYGILLIGLAVICVLIVEDGNNLWIASVLLAPVALATLVSGWRLSAGRSAGHWLWAFGFFHVVFGGGFLLALILD